MTTPPTAGEPSAGPPQQQRLQAPKNVNLQFVDDTWERLLNAVERLEQVTEGFRALSATRLDRHADRDRIVEVELEVRTEVHLQIVCLQRVVHPVRAESSWMVQDFLTWFGGRRNRATAPADEYAGPIVRCILGLPYELPPLETAPATESDILDATEALASGLHQADRIEERFLADPDAEATQHRHERGTLHDGLHRLASLDPRLAAHLTAPQTDQPPTVRDPLD